MKPDETDDLIARHLGGALSPEEQEQLLKLAQESPEAQQALGLHLALDRLIRESRKPPLDPELVLRALPRGSQEDFIGAVMGRLPHSPGTPASEPVNPPPRTRSASRRGSGRFRGGWRGSYLIPGLAAAGVLGAFVLYATLESPGTGKRGAREEAGRVSAILSEPRAAGREELLPGARSAGAEEERDRAQAERRRAQEILAALRREESRAAEERDRAELVREAEARGKAEVELERIRTEREAAQAAVVEARERERRAAAEAARAADVPPASEGNPSSAGTQAVTAVLERTQGSVRRGEGKGVREARTGEALRAGDGVVTGIEPPGTATLVFGDRTTLELAPGTELREIFEREDEGKGTRGKRLYLSKGRVSATVARQPEGQPFILSTPHGEARVLGTTLRLTVEAAPAGGLTRLEVVEGKVRLQRRDGKAVDVTSGHLAVAADGVDLSPRVILDRAHFEAGLVRRPDLLFFEDFEEDRWKRHWSSPSETSRVTEDRSVPVIGRRALEVRCRAGEPAGDGWHRLTLPAGSPRLHLRAYFYFPKDFDFAGSAGQISLFRMGALPVGRGVEEGLSLWADHTPSGRDFYSAALVLSARGALQFYYYHPDQKSPKGEFEDCGPAGAVALVPGRWHAVELLCQANDPGAKNGLLRAWVDGAFWGEVRGIRFRDAESLLLREMALIGFSGPSPRDQSYFVDDVVLAREYIGIAPGDADGVPPRVRR